LPEKRWNWRRISTVLRPEIRKERRQGGGESLMDISMIEALVPAASTTKSN
jgi:hypothetical protein